MEPLTLGLIGLGLYVASRFSGGGGGGSKPPTPQLPAGDPGFAAFAPPAQDKAWYAATSILWTPMGSVADASGNRALIYSGLLASGDQPAQRSAADQWFRGAMAQDMRIVVSEKILVPQQGYAAHMAMVPSGFTPKSLPADWGPMLQLYQPAAQGLGQQPGQQPNGEPFGDIPDVTLRQKVRTLADSDTASLLDLDAAADQMEKLGYMASAARLRERRKNLAAARQLAANDRGGWPYLVRSGDLPINVAQYYGGKAGAPLSALGKLNPEVAANQWAKWTVGEEVLLPLAWGDPSRRPLPPLAYGSLPGGGGGAPPKGGAAPKAKPGDRPDLIASQKWYYGPGGEGPFTYVSDSEVPANASKFGWKDGNGNSHASRYDPGILYGPQAAAAMPPTNEGANLKEFGL